MIEERAEQGGLKIERMCELAGMSRAGFYRHWEESAPKQLDTALRDEIQRIVLERRFYGYRRVTAQLRLEARGKGCIVSVGCRFLHIKRPAFF